MLTLEMEESLIKNQIFNLEDHLPENFSGKSRVWIYQSSRLFTIAEAFEIEKILKDFLNVWNSHGAPVKGYANLFFGRFIILLADETQATVGGCSTDSSVAVIRQIQEKFGTDMFNRRQLAFYINGKVEMLPMEQMTYATENRFVKRDTIYFNNTVQTLDELRKDWMTPAENTWLKRYFA